MKGFNGAMLTSTPVISEFIFFIRLAVAAAGEGKKNARPIAHNHPLVKEAACPLPTATCQRKSESSGNGVAW